jgi:hypothetical protein
MNVWNTHRTRFAIALTLLGALGITSPQASLAQTDVGACGAYSSQEDAQADLDGNPDLAPELDPDGNGIACEAFQSEETPVDVGACGAYSSQGDAQADLDADPGLAADLDPDGNGVACEGFGADEETSDGQDEGEADEAVSALPETGSGANSVPNSLNALVAGLLALAAAAGSLGHYTLSGTSRFQR